MASLEHAGQRPQALAVGRPKPLTPSLTTTKNSLNVYRFNPYPQHQIPTKF
jgi:hypothetical protein